MQPYPGTAIFNYCVENNLIDQETIEKIYNGEGSFHRDSLLKSGELKFAQILKLMVPLLIKFPVLSPLINFIINKELIGLGKILYLI